MGIDLEQRKRGRAKLTCRRQPRSVNVYLRLLHRVYSFLARRSNSAFNKVVARRLVMSLTHRPVVSVKTVAVAYKKRVKVDPKCIVVTVANVLNDHRILRMPKGLKLCCLKISESARSRIIAEGGEVLTFDQLALREPLGKHTVLLRGPLKARKAFRYFNGKPYTRSEGRKFEKGKLHGKVKRNKKYYKKN